MLLSSVKFWVSRTTAGAAEVIHSQQLQELIDGRVEEKPVLLDCRSPEEFAVSRLAGAINLPLNRADDPQVLSEAVAGSADVVCYCSVGYRSGLVALKVKEVLDGQERAVFNLSGGLFEWANQGRPFVGQHVHPFNGFFGLCLERRLRS